jgi:hypothetical protein
MTVALAVVVAVVAVVVAMTTKINAGFYCNFIAARLALSDF